MKRIATALVIAAFFSTLARGQEFINLNFESAYNLPGDPPESGTLVSVTNALPGWTAYNGDVVLSSVFYTSNYVFGTEEAVGLDGGSIALSGDFSAALYLGGAISQTALVPDSAESLEFEASSDINLEVTLGGQSLSYSALSESPGYTVYGANIPAGLDGQVEGLTLSLQGLGGTTILDNIEFSTSSVPEPGEWALVCVGAVLVVVRRRRGPGR